ncbi:UDP-N-acetylglucosamine--N-acetylmuramyl- (pentapeptide) pyrophosphoryl-UDP N- acetylglucosamine transferase [Nitritalea halalkaliphila LW7]|uniref:UDP-N-acetylglucosamine--N-acetylmuramyl-(Pentapeptide) pyrophosphoryl-UDP N-acetylglucosamine transferase n=1 Tax=Nitritalea halalkaliphila LW7 TaxID=1189621 RepID=I5C2D7_9BACT|nr:UDP-N-acetylglucosamine--N-acetylmuramyl- (pentapeptide) pyrophosphoryl-UDP N- acetylglucosamine transferase [Nitritalea halalkaliphila LW7]
MGIPRALTWKHLLLPGKLWKSLSRARTLIRQERPDAVLGFGGYASGPVLFAAQNKGIPTLVQEQNAYAGLTNKLLAKRARRICVAYSGMERFFPQEKLLVTGNPVRREIVEGSYDQAAARQLMGLSERPTLLVLGGSLGAKALNEAVLAHLPRLEAAGIQVIWQCGALYEERLRAALAQEAFAHVQLRPFIADMAQAYAAADVIVSRAGALSVSELCVVGKAVVFVPSPNVAEDHQTKNAAALLKAHAARALADAELMERFGDTVLDLFQDEAARQQLGEAIRGLALPKATETIVNEIEQLIDAD